MKEYLELGDPTKVLADIDITLNYELTIQMAGGSTLRDSPSLVNANEINSIDVDDPLVEPKLKPSKAYALVLGHRRLCTNSVKILHRAQAIQGEHF